MKNKSVKMFLGIMMSVIVATISIPVVNAQETVPAGEENVDAVVQNLVEETEELEGLEDEVYDDLEVLGSLGLAPEIVEGAQVDGEDVIYTYKITDDCVNEVAVEQTEDAVVMQVTEGDIQNEVVFNDDGSVYLDGEEVIYEIEETDADAVDSNIQDAVDEDDADSNIQDAVGEVAVDSDIQDAETIQNMDAEDSELTQSTGGWKWSASKPGKIKKYGSYKAGWKCANVKFAKEIRELASASLLALLFKSVFFGSKVSSLISSMDALKKSDPYSKGVSYKTYSAKAVSPKDNRYCKVKTVMYSRVNYKGTSKMGYLYGTMM